MKKIILLLILILIIITLTACDGDDPTTPESEINVEPPSEPISEEVISVYEPSPPPESEVDVTSEDEHTLTSLVPLSAEMERRVKEDWVAWRIGENPQISEYLTVEGTEIYRFYGTYNGAIAAMLHSDIFGYGNVWWEETIAEITVGYSNANFIVVWYDGAFLQLQSAYDEGVLTKEDIETIAYYHHRQM